MHLSGQQKETLRESCGVMNVENTPLQTDGKPLWSGVRNELVESVVHGLYNP